MPIVAVGLPGGPDAASLVREHGASNEDISDREHAAADDLLCYVTFSGIEDSVLGLGLQVHPRSAQQRRLNLSPELDLVCDYIDVEAFNEGVRHAASRHARRDETCQLPAMVSSTRKPLNGWLPLYVNAEHWARSKCYSASAFNLLMGRKPGAPLKPKDALNICCSLLTCAVVGFTKGQTACGSPRAATRGTASERAVQMYADVHRLMLQLAKEHPEMRTMAESRLQKFIESPAGRTRECTRSLGDLIHCLLITENYTWEDMAGALIPEALRRQVMRQDWKGKTFSSWELTSEEQLITSWDDFAPLSGMVACCCIMLYKRVGRPNACSLTEVEACYDRRWGRLHKDTISDLVSICTTLRNQTSVSSFFALAFPDCLAGMDASGTPGGLMTWAENCEREHTRESLAEHILWAEKFGRCWTNESIPEEDWPNLHGPYPLLQEWRRAHLRQQLDQKRRAAARRGTRQNWRQQYEDLWQQGGWNEEWGVEADPRYLLWLQWLPGSRHGYYWQESNFWQYEANRGIPEYESPFVQA